MATNRWRGVEVAGWFALAVGVGSVVLYTVGTRSQPAVPSLLYPYLASGSVFLVTCVWILSSAGIGLREQISDASWQRAWGWFWGVFVGASAVLLLGAGFAGDAGDNAVLGLNWYLFGSENDPMQNATGWAKRGIPFGLIAACSNGLALGTLVFLGALCNGLTLQAEGDDIGVTDVLEMSRKLFHVLILASALMVTSTLTLYLLFGTSDQIQPLRAAKAVQVGQKPAAAASPPAASPTLVCTAPDPKGAALTCTLQGADARTKPASSAAYMAMVCGLSFTGVLFILFMSCSAALDDRIAALMAASAAPRPQPRTRPPRPFSVKEWRERHGVVDAGATSQVLKALALLAPALTGFLTLLTA